MIHTCKHSKCLKEDEILGKCEVVEFKNVIQPSCKKLMTMFGEDEWEGPFFCGKRCFKQNKALNAASSKAKGRVPWHNADLALTSIPWQL